MAELFDRFNQWFGSLQEQEQRVLMYGAPVILVLVVYLLVFQPLGSAYFARQSEMTERREDIAWIRDQRDMLERVNTSCDLRSQNFSADNFNEEIEATARRFGITPILRAQRAADGFEMQISSAEGNRILSMVRALACSGTKVTSMEMQKLADSNELSATLTLVYAGANN